MVVNLAQAWGDGSGKQSLTESEALEIPDDVLQLIDPVAYHQKKALQHEDALREDMVEHQIVQVRQDRDQEMQFRQTEEILNRIEVHNQVAYHDFVDRVNDTDHVLARVQEHNRVDMMQSRYKQHDIWENSLMSADGRHIFMSKDGKTGVYDSGDEITDPAVLAQGRIDQRANPSAPCKEDYLPTVANTDAKTDMYENATKARETLDGMKAEIKPVPGDADYAEKIAGYNKRWADIIDTMTEADRDALFAGNADAREAYDAVKADPTYRPNGGMNALPGDLSIQASYNASASGAPAVSASPAAQDLPRLDGAGKTPSVSFGLAAAGLTPPDNGMASGPAQPTPALGNILAFDMSVRQNTGLTSSYNGIAAGQDSARPAGPSIPETAMPDAVMPVRTAGLSARQASG